MGGEEVEIGFWLWGQERPWLWGLFFSLRQVKRGWRQEWLRLQKGAWGPWRGSDWAKVGGLRPVCAAATAFHPLQKLTVDLTAVQGVLQSQQPNLQHRVQQGEHATGSSRLFDLYWQAMKVLGVQ